MIYLDNAATTFPKPEAVYQAMDNAARNFGVNAGRGSYAMAREATALMDKTKRQMLDLVNSQTGKVVFTPSITIALNEILQGLPLQAGDNVYISPYEHNAVARTLHLIEQTRGINIILMPLVSDTLEIDIDRLRYMFSQQIPKCVCCIHVSNVTGYILPIREIFDAASKYEAITVLDTAQSLGLVEIDAQSLALDYLAFAGHKSLYGPFGIGGFIELRGNKLNPFIVGGTGSNSLNLDMPLDSPGRFEPSSPNIVAIAGLSAALENLPFQSDIEREKRLMKNLIDELSALDGIRLLTPPEDSHIGVLSFTLDKYSSEDVGIILDQDFYIAVRTGYHCAPYIHSYLEDRDYFGTVRVGLGRYSTSEDVNALVNALKEL